MNFTAKYETILIYYRSDSGECRLPKLVSAKYHALFWNNSDLWNNDLTHIGQSNNRNIQYRYATGLAVN